MEGSARLPYSGAQHQALLDTLYATPTDPALWRHFLHQLVTVSQSRSARLLVLDKAAETVRSSTKINIDDRAHQDYVNYFVNTCPWRPELREKPTGRLYSTYLDFSCRQRRFYQTEFYNDWARELDIHHGVCGTVYQTHDYTVQLLVQRTGGQGPYQAPDTRWFNELVPHVRRAIDLTRHVHQLEWGHRGAQTAAHRPFAVLGKGGRVEFLCDRAQALIAGRRQPGLPARTPDAEATRPAGALPGSGGQHHRRRRPRLASPRRHCVSAPPEGRQAGVHGESDRTRHRRCSSGSGRPGVGVFPCAGVRGHGGRAADCRVV